MDNREIVVKGIGKMSAKPDLLVLDMNLEVVESEYGQAMLRSTEFLDELRTAIVSAGHDGKQLKTTSFHVNAKYDGHPDKQGNWQQEFVGYSCTHGLRLEFDLDTGKLGTTLGAIAKCKASPRFSIRFSVKDTSAASEQLLENAIQNARWKARILAKYAGVELGIIKRIDYNWTEHRFYSNTDMAMQDGLRCLAAPEAMTIGIEPEDIKVSDTATIVWAIG